MKPKLQIVRKPSTVLEEALEWRARLDDEELADTERLAFQEWLQQDLDHEVMFDYADRFWDASERLRVEISAQELSRLQAPGAADRGPYSRRLLWAVGAAAVFLLGALGIFYLAQPKPTSMPPQVIELRTERGAISTFDLSDGTTLILGAASEVNVNLTEAERRVYLMKGDAYFDVVSDASRPFLVNAGRLQVLVTGTTFDVRRSGAVTEIAVVEGTVAVSEGPGNASTSEGLSDNQNTEILSAGFRIEFSDARGFGGIKETRADRIGAWRRDRLVFEDAPISEIVADLNRYLAEPLLVADEDVGAMTFSATVGTADLESFVSTLTEVFPVRLKRRSDGTRLLLPSGE